MRYIKDFTNSLNSMNECSSGLIIWAMRLTAVMLCCAMIIIALRGCTPQSYYAYRCALELIELPKSILLVAVLAAAITEDYTRLS